MEYVLVLMAVALALKKNKTTYVSLKEIRKESEAIEKTHAMKLVDSLEDYLQELSDRRIVDIRSLNEIGINGVSSEGLESFLDALFERLRNSAGRNTKRTEVERLDDQLKRKFDFSHDPPPFSPLSIPWL